MNPQTAPFPTLDIGRAPEAIALSLGFMTNDSTSRIEKSLREWIGGSAPGSRLPTSRQIVVEYGVSPLTVQKVITALAREGLIETRPGVGTFTRPTRRVHSADLGWQVEALGSSRIRPVRNRALDVGSPDAIALHAGYPAAELLPAQMVRSAFAKASRSESSVHRPPLAGVSELRGWFAAELAQATASDVNPPDRSDVLIAPGSQSGLAAVFRSTVAPGGTLLVESPTYWGAIRAAAQAGIRIVAVASGIDGPDPKEVARALESSGARAFYVQPDFANPTGIQWSNGVRDSMVELARETGTFLIEDDWAHDFGIERDSRPLSTLDDTGHVVYIRSLTKSVSPAMRVAGVVARGPIRDRILADVGSESLYVSGLLQQAALEVVTQNRWRIHLRNLRRELASRRDLLLEAVRAHLPEGTVDSVPQGGLNLWLRLPDSTDLDRLERDCEAAGVLIAAGDEWFPVEPVGKFIRLNFAGPSPDRYSQAMSIVASQLTAQE